MGALFDRGKYLILGFGLAVSGAVGCGLLDPEPSDGEVCESDSDCTTEHCTSYGLCSHSRCECPSGQCAEGGELSSDCRDGWRCVGYDSIFDPVKEFFGAKVNESDGYCQPSCEDGCPDHYLCNGGDEFCSPDPAWAYPVPAVSWTGDASGELSGRDQSLTVVVEDGSTITLNGSGSSPRGAPIVGLSWTTVSSAADYMDFEGPTIETTVPAGSYRRVELRVADDEARSGMLTVIFDSCHGPGTTCGYQGSGCCNSCDDATDTCL
ncbi:hypothetical protein ENSA5_17230 [Enhygromyxa salina]|uniref:Uncharacterized protein n=1 Tax=Enhygromyxa salina TaxID=215803 RepID=A0A2S9YE45_9BACT|nr:hypothetical protein [Enhygromyxa salina]PRQ03286.1 hypothetical protein ENSA5_17230 [Enhygromyxa salina]